MILLDLFHVQYRKLPVFFCYKSIGRGLTGVIDMQ